LSIVNCSSQDAGLLNGILTEDAMNVAIKRDTASHILHNTLFATLVQYNQQFIPMRAEKVEIANNVLNTLAQQYYNLSVLTGVAVANSWANLSGVTLSPGMTSAFVIRTVDGWTNSGSLQVAQDIPLEVLGHEVSIYAHTKVYPTTTASGQWDYIYGVPKKTARSAEAVAYGDGNAYNSSFFVTSGDHLNKSGDAAAELYSNPTGASAIPNNNSFINYKAWNTTDNSIVTAGSPIAYIDNDSDGAYEYAIARNLVYSKVTNVNTNDANKVIAARGDVISGGFDNGRSLNNVEMANIYKGADLKVDTRALVYGIGDKFGVEIVAPTKGTLTQARDGGNIAVIGGTEYKESALLSRVSTMSAVLSAGNFNAEKEYYIDKNAKILEGPGAAPDGSVWALVLDSHYNIANLYGGGATAQVQLLLQDGTKGEYALTGVTDGAGNGYAVGSAGYTPVTDDKVRLDDDGASATADFGGPYDLVAKNVAIFKATVSEDGKSVSLQNPGVSIGGDHSANGLRYAKGNSYFDETITSPLQTRSRIMDGTVIFAVNLKTESTLAITDKVVVESAGAFIGRTLNSITTGSGNQTPVTRVNVMHNSSFDNANTSAAGVQDGIAAMAIASPDVDPNKPMDGKFAYVLAVDIVTTNAAGDKFYAELTVWDGSEVKTYTTVDGVKSRRLTWKEEYINTPQTGLTGHQTLAVSSGDSIQYALNADGKISSLVTYQNFTGDPLLLTNATTNVGEGEAIVGYSTVSDTAWTRVYPGAGNIMNSVEMFMTNDTNYYAIYPASDPDDSTATKIEKIPAAKYYNGVKVIMLYKADGTRRVAHTVYVFPGDEKDVEQAIDDATPAPSVPTANFGLVVGTDPAADPAAITIAASGTNAGKTYELIAWNLNGAVMPTGSDNFSGYFGNLSLPFNTTARTITGINWGVGAGVWIGYRATDSTVTNWSYVRASTQAAVTALYGVLDNANLGFNGTGETARVSATSLPELGVAGGAFTFAASGTADNNNYSGRISSDWVIPATENDLAFISMGGVLGVLADQYGFASGDIVRVNNPTNGKYATILGVNADVNGNVKLFEAADADLLNSFDIITDGTGPITIEVFRGGTYDDTLAPPDDAKVTYNSTGATLLFKVTIDPSDLAIIDSTP
jgi:hypothetical protein